MTVLERTYNAYVQGDHDDDVVWSNLAYPLAAKGRMVGAGAGGAVRCGGHASADNRDG